MAPGKDQRETILVVEDDAVIAELEKMHLERVGFTVEIAATSGDALDRLRRHPVDLILLDYRLPGEADGLEVYLEWKAMGFELPVVMVTGFSDEAVAIRALCAGVRDLITKSAEYLDYLPEAVERVLKQVRTERQLAESEALLSSIIDSANDAIIIAEAGLEITLFNQAAEAIFRCPAGHALGRPVGDFITDEADPGLERDSEDSHAAQRPWIRLGSYGVRGMRSDGTEFPAELSVSRTEVDGRGFYTVIVRDVTERKLAEVSLRHRLELQQQLSMIAESVPGVIYTFRMRPDGSASMPFATPAIEELYGFSAGVLAEDLSPFYANVHPDDILALKDSVNEAFQLSSVWHDKFRYLHPVKGRRWIEGWSSPRVEPDGSVLWHGFVMDVTDREQAEAGRRESERFARSVLDSLSSHIAVLDAWGNILAVNTAWRMFARANGAIGEVCDGYNYLHVCDSVTGEEREAATAFAAGVREVLAGHRASFELEYPCHSRSERRWYIGRVTAFPEGGPRRVVVAHQDITAIKRAEEQLRESERMLRQSQKMAQVGSWEMDLDVRSEIHPVALRWSDECFRIFGYEPGQVAVTNDLFLRAVHPEDRASVRAAVVRALRENGTYATEHRIVRPDGTERVVVEWGEMITDSDGEPTRILGTCQDITERKSIERALRASDERLALATQSAGLGSWDSDLATGQITWSPRQQELFGFAPGEFGGTIESLFDRVHPEDRDGLEQAISRARASGEPYEHEYRVVLPGGAVRWIAGFGRNYYNASGRAVRVVGVCLDITERKRAEMGLQRYANRLEHLREIDLAILSSRSPREIAEAALGHLARIVPYWTGGVAAYDLDCDAIDVIASLGILRGWHPPGTRFHDPLKDRPEIADLRQGRVSSGEDVLGMDFASPLMESLKAAGMRSFIRVPLLDGGRLIGTIFLVSDRPRAFSTEQVDVVREVANQLAIAIRQALLLDEVKAAKVRLEELSRRLIRAQEEEQRRIARELHDEVGQNLTAVKIILNVLAGEASGPNLGQRLRDAAAMTGLALEQVRDLSRLLRPSLLDDLGLAEALRALVEGLAEKTSLAAAVDVDDVGPVDPEVETACYRITQEALTNAIKHSAATRLSVALRRNGDALELVIEDNGTGFDVAAAWSRAAHGSSLGILGLEERAMLAGGRSEIISRPGLGTRIRTVVPATGRAGSPRAARES